MAQMVISRREWFSSMEMAISFRQKFNLQDIVDRLRWWIIWNVLRDTSHGIGVGKLICCTSLCFFKRKTNEEPCQKMRDWFCSQFSLVLAQWLLPIVISALHLGHSYSFCVLHSGFADLWSRIWISACSAVSACRVWPVPCYSGWRPTYSREHYCQRSVWLKRFFHYLDCCT